jgi:3-hydroxybutyryl-CoA dehydrogenase
MSIERALVAGAGLMGHGIAQVLASAGRTVDLYEPDLARAEAGRARIVANLERAVAKGRIDATAANEIADRVAATARIVVAEEADLVVEAVFEDEAVKRRLWAELDGRAPGRAVFASNTSSISIDRIAEALAPGRRSHFCGMHFFSPVPVMPLVELIRGGATDEATIAAVRALASDLGKQVIVSADRPGFIVNRILMPLLAEAVRALEDGIGSADDIDTGARVGLNHPMGPLALADFIGLDVVLGVMRVLHADLGDARFAPPHTLEDLVAAGKLGRKTGEGFFRHPRG